jgi:hypothetical protein
MIAQDDRSRCATSEVPCNNTHSTRRPSPCVRVYDQASTGLRAQTLGQRGCNCHNIYNRGDMVVVGRGSCCSTSRRVDNPWWEAAAPVQVAGAFRVTPVTHVTVCQPPWALEKTYIPLVRCHVGATKGHNGHSLYWRGCASTLCWLWEGVRGVSFGAQGRCMHRQVGRRLAVIATDKLLSTETVSPTVQT